MAIAPAQIGHHGRLLSIEEGEGAIGRERALLLDALPGTVELGCVGVPCVLRNAVGGWLLRPTASCARQATRFSPQCLHFPATW